MAASAPQPDADCTCPVCCDIFKDPVVLLCGHSFCKDCVQQWWRQSRLQTCPVCKEIFPMAQPPRNLALRNLSDTLRQERSQRATPASNQLCTVHSEKLKLFCQDDRQLICVICRDAQKHKKHNCAPIDEAAEEQRTKLKVQMVQLKSKLGSFNAQKVIYDKMASHIKLQAQQTEKTIKEEFEKLYQFLRAEETARIDAVRKEATRKSVAMNIRIVNLSAEISSLADKITTIEGEMKAEDFLFMMNLKTTMERSQCNLPEPETPSGALIDEAKHVGNLQFTVWEKMRTIIQYTPVIVDPNTGCPSLVVSKHLTCSSDSDKSQPLPENPERVYGGILGSKSFSSGKHSWDVEVGGYWAVGVAARIKDQTDVNTWGIYMCVCTDIIRQLTPEDDVKIVSEDLFPQKVRVQLDYDQGTLSFLDLDSKRHIYTIKHRFTHPLFPYFRNKAKLLPYTLSLRVSQPS